MIHKIVAVLCGAGLLFAVDATMAADYRPDEFLSLDLSTAALSSKRLGPPTEFAKVPVEANSDHVSEAAWARQALDTEPRAVAVQRVAVARPHRKAHAASMREPHAPVREAKAADRHRGEARTRLAHRHGNPFDAQAMDTRIQKWPCRTGGGICDWK